MPGRITICENHNCGSSSIAVRRSICLLLLLTWYVEETVAKIFVHSQENNETVRIIYDKNTRAMSEAVQGYLIVSNPPTACSPVESPPNRTEPSPYLSPFSISLMKQWTLLAMVDDCDITVKAKNAHRAGYSALIIQNMGSNKSDAIHWHTLKFPLARINAINKVIVGEYDGDLLKYNYSYPKHKYYIRFEEDHFYQYVCYAFIGFIFILLGTIFFIFWIQICCTILHIAPRFIRYRLGHFRQSGKRKLSKPLLELIPIKNWNSGYALEFCAICQENFVEADEFRLLPCLHGFHRECIDKWLLERSRRCPNCMQRIRFQRVPKSSEIGVQCDGDTGEFDRDPLLQTDLDDDLDTELYQTPERSAENMDSIVMIRFNPEDNARVNQEQSQQVEEEEKNLDWQLRRFLANFSFVPSSQESVEMTSEQAKEKSNSENAEVIVAEINIEMKDMPLLDTCLDSYTSEDLCRMDIGGNFCTPGTTTLDLLLHRSKQFKDSEATTISESLPRDDSTFFDDSRGESFQFDNSAENDGDDDDDITARCDIEEDVFDECTSML